MDSPEGIATHKRRRLVFPAARPDKLPMTPSIHLRVLRGAALWLVPSVLIAIALLQQYRARVLDQSSWIGCGFGMFATLDNHTSRFVRVRVSAGGDRWGSVPDEFRALELRARVIPTAENLRRLAEAMSRTEDARALARPAVQLRLFRVRLEPRSNRLSVYPSLTIQVP